MPCFQQQQKIMTHINKKRNSSSLRGTKEKLIEGVPLPAHIKAQ